MIRSVQDARSVQEAHRGRWSAAVRWAIAEELWRAGEFHSDALLDLKLPDDARNIIGAQVAAAAAKGLMEATGERRKSAAKARNGAKSAVYRITPLGRERFAGLFEPAVGGSDADETGSPGPSTVAPSSPPEPLFEPSADHTRVGHFDLDQRAA